ncbi:MAG: class II fructose-bisphosphate aldolase, partial [Gammaproteobacteria bacterium]|nr:class II fructose-bisphosphate aldolase [Gammaproteobacteria bacterium]
MALISLRQLLDHAAENDYGVPAFNVNNLEQVRAIMEGADAINSPVILQASAGARKYAGSNFLKYLIQAAIEEFPHIPIVMHQDHGTSPAVCQRSIQLGFSSVMMDGSLGEDGKTPTDFDYNVKVTRQAVDMAHACGVSVEGEIGCLGSLETGLAGEEDGIGAEGQLSLDQMLTDPEEAEEFVNATGV